jgi:hypothetical protein
MLHPETATHLITNTVPKTILTELMILGDRTKLHQTPIGSKPFRLDKFVIRRPVGQLQTATIQTKTGIIKIALDAGNFVGRRFHGRNTRRGAVVRVRPDGALVVKIAAVVGD